MRNNRLRHNFIEDTEEATPTRRRPTIEPERIGGIKFSASRTFSLIIIWVYFISMIYFIWSS
jgi:hypothetical protein